MLTELYEELLKPAVRGKNTFMGILAVAVFENVRFAVSDFGSEGEPPEYVLNMTLLANDKDRVGKHLGEPLSISAKIVEQALTDAKSADYGKEATEIRIISAILAHGRIANRLEKKCIGGCPPEFTRLFSNQKKAWKEKAELKKATSKACEPSPSTHAAPRKANRL